jgi:PDZ domain/Aspartyl protease
MTDTVKRSNVMSGGLLIDIAIAFFLLASAAASESPLDSRILAGSQSVVPVSVEAGEVVVDVSINGRGPFPLMFDTGAQDTLTPETVAALGLQTEGTAAARDSGGKSVPISLTHVAAVRIGESEMTNQSFAVVALPPYLTDRGSRSPLAGFIGYELLARFAARLDYESKTLTLSLGRDFRYDGKGIRVPLVLTDKTPVVLAAADHNSGMFVVDTGSTEALTLQRKFVQNHDIETHHPSAIRIKSVGAAGPFETILTRLDRFDIAGSRIDRPATRFPSIRGIGLPLTNVDGSIGYEILRQFVVTFDYQHAGVWFERSRAFGMRTGQGSAGFQAAKIEGKGFAVTTVLPNTAAALAGIRTGDLITHVNNESTVSMSPGELVTLLRQPIGTSIRVVLIRDGIVRQTALTLRDVLP